MQKINLNTTDRLDFRTKESYKTLRTNLEFSGRNRRVIAVTSCTPNEGKTSVSFQLALSIAEGGRSVMLLDADQRKSVLRSRYRVSTARYGLSHYLSGQASITDVVCETNIPNFSTIFSGPVPPNPSELLGGEAFGELVGYLRERYDYVIVDTPPLGSVIDGAVAVKHCDGVVFVIESGAISYKFAQSVKEQLDKADCPIVGVVLNKVPMGGKGYYGKYYGKYYGRYYGTYGEEEQGSLEASLMEKPPRAGKGARPERNERSERADRPEKEGRAERNGRMERNGRPEKDGKAEKPVRPEKAGAEKAEKPEKEGHGSQPEKEGRAEKPGKEGRPEETPMEGRSEKQAGRPERAERASRQGRGPLQGRRERGRGRKDMEGEIVLLDEDVEFVRLEEDGAEGSAGEATSRKEENAEGGEKA